MRAARCKRYSSATARVARAESPSGRLGDSNAPYRIAFVFVDSSVVRFVDRRDNDDLVWVRGH